MYLKIKKALLKPDRFGNNIEITMIGLYDENDKWIKWVKINEQTLNNLINNKTPYNE